MKKSIYIIVAVLAVLSLVFFFQSANGTEDVPFNVVELSTNNGVLNSTDNRFYDTILSVGLDQAGIAGVEVQIQELSDAAKSNFEGELKAHIKYFNGIYYLFIDNFDRREAIEVIAHEIIHINQYKSGQIVYDYQTGLLEWEGQPLDINQIEYDRRPWEMDAHQKDNELESLILGILY